MRVIVFESTVYRVTEKQFAELQKMHYKFTKGGVTFDYDIKLSDYIESVKSNYKLIGDVEFDFRL